MTEEEAVAAYDCMLGDMKAAYAKSDNSIAANYTSFRRYSTRAYVSDTHGGRYVQNYANDTAKAYGAFEDAGVFPAGSVLAKDSIGVKPNGSVSVGPLFLMEKMAAGFNAGSGDWRYTLILPSGATVGTTNGAGSAKVEFCITCHVSVTPDQDSVMLLPEEVRTSQ